MFHRCSRRFIAVYMCNVLFVSLNVLLWSHQPRRQRHYVRMSSSSRKVLFDDDVVDTRHQVDVISDGDNDWSSMEGGGKDVKQKEESLLAARWKSRRNKTRSSILPKPPVPDAVADASRTKSLGKPTEFNPSRKHLDDYDLYKIPPIERTDLVNCASLLAGDAAELAKANRTMKSRPKVPIYEETYLEWSKDCSQFRLSRGYVEVPLSVEEEQFPLAFSIAMYRDVEQMERLLRAIYQPQNLYCIHIDTKSSLLIHRTVAAIARCFDNVWIATHLDKIKWGDISVILPEINCMRDLMRFYRGRFRYFINLTGQEFPLRTNLELVRIANIFNGSNDIAGSVSRMDMERVNYQWTHRWSKTYQQTIFYNTYLPKPPFQLNLTFFKGELHGLFSRRMVEYLVEDRTSQSYLEWCWDTGHPSEHYWNTLNYNVFLGAPGGYQGPLDVADAYSPEPVIRAKNWIGLYGERTCQGKELRGICVYGVADVPWLAERRELFANKFQLTYEYLAVDCLEERHRNRTSSRRVANDFDEHLYRSLPTVLYSRKDGL